MASKGASRELIRQARLRLATSGTDTGRDDPARMSDAALVAALVGSNECAAEVMATYGNLPCLARAEVDELRRHMGGPHAIALTVAFELGRRARAPRPADVVVRSALDIYNYYSARLCHLRHEVFHVMCLDCKHQLVRDARIVEGGLTTCSVLPREAFAPALRASAPVVVFVHNHPSGDPRPSQDDLSLTAQLKKAAGVLGITALDHVIIGDGRYQSMAENGQLAAM